VAQLLPVPITPFPALITCYSRTPFYTTNGAPEAGAVVIMWTYGTERGEQEYHLQTIPVGYGDTFDMFEVTTPCSTYLRVYFQPDSTKLLYYMPSQFWPHDLYGTAHNDFEVGPSITPSSRSMARQRCDTRSDPIHSHHHADALAAPADETGLTHGVPDVLRQWYSQTRR
jgi:hypothetical protein